LNLLDALRLLGGDKEFKAAMGDELVDGFIKMKTAEWNSYVSHLTQWELDHTLDC
jgi:glutamine synthetase